MVCGQTLPKGVLNIVSVLARLGIGAIFLWSSLPKLRQPYDFLLKIHEYELVSAKMGLLAAMVIPWLELALGICLLGGIFVGGALLTTAGLMGLFVFVQISALHRNLPISCGCFGMSDTTPISYGTLIRTLILMLMVVGAYGLYVFHRDVPHRHRPHGSQSRPPMPRPVTPASGAEITAQPGV